jgi:hypothetical protein
MNTKKGFIKRIEVVLEVRRNEEKGKANYAIKEKPTDYPKGWHNKKVGDYRFLKNFIKIYKAT